VSSGCIRMTNQDVIDLYNRVQIGATVIVHVAAARPKITSARGRSWLVTEDVKAASERCGYLEWRDRSGSGLARCSASQKSLLEGSNPILVFVAELLGGPGREDFLISNSHCGRLSKI
jgi:L,D-transpeptidase catalytic domain